MIMRNTSNQQLENTVFLDLALLTGMALNIKSQLLNLAPKLYIFVYEGLW